MDLHCLQRQGISGFSRTRVNVSASAYICVNFIIHEVVSCAKFILPTIQVIHLFCDW